METSAAASPSYLEEVVQPLTDHSSSKDVSADVLGSDKSLPDLSVETSLTIGKITNKASPPLPSGKKGKNTLNPKEAKRTVKIPGKASVDNKNKPKNLNKNPGYKGSKLR